MSGLLIAIEVPLYIYGILSLLMLAGIRLAGIDREEEPQWKRRFWFVLFLLAVGPAVVVQQLAIAIYKRIQEI